MHVRSHLYTNVCWFHWLAAQVHEMEVVCSNPTRQPFQALFFFHHSCSATAPTIGPAQSRGLCVRRLAVRRKMRRIEAPFSESSIPIAEASEPMGRPTCAGKPCLLPVHFLSRYFSFFSFFFYFCLYFDVF